MRLQTIMFLMLLMSFILSCKSEKAPLAVGSDNTPFPLISGSSWTYEYSDTSFDLYNNRITEINHGILKINLLDSVKLGNGEKALLWQSRFQENVDSLFVRWSGDSLIFYKNRKYPYIAWVFIFPLKVGRKWEINGCDYYEVLTNDTLNLPSFKNIVAFKIRENFHCEGNASRITTYDLSPKLWIVKYDFDYTVTIHYFRKHQVWLLRSYSIE